MKTKRFPHMHLALLGMLCGALLIVQGCTTPPAVGSAMHGIHTIPEVITVGILQTRLTFNTTVFLRLTYLQAGAPTKIEVVRSSGLPLVDECAVFNAREWTLDRTESTPTVRIVPMKLYRNLSQFPVLPRA